MYLIEYVKEDLDYEAYEQRNEYFKLGYVESEELAREICNTYGINFEYTKQDVYDSAQEFFKNHVKWETSIHINIDFYRKEIEFNIYSNPDYEEEIIHYPTYQFDLSGRNKIGMSITFKTDVEVTKFDENSIRFTMKHVFKSEEKFDKSKIGETVFKLFVDEINKQFDANVAIGERAKLKSFGSGEYK